MKPCPKCGIEHNKSGKFCSRKCANSRSWTDEHKQVFSERQAAYMASERAEGHKVKRSIQMEMMAKAGKSFNSKAVEDPEDVMTNPDDYYFAPPFDPGRGYDVDDGAVWEEVDR
jgi:endogenous inhibitor of DNA gyrase (YacG/DUF329 family)